MNFDFDRALNGLIASIPNFDPSNFTSKGIVPPKP